MTGVSGEGKLCRCRRSFKYIKGLQRISRGLRSNVGLGGCEPPQPILLPGRTDDRSIHCGFHFWRELPAQTGSRNYSTGFAWSVMLTGPDSELY